MTDFQRDIIHQLDFFDIVSFDVFDTLLLRPVMYPYDVFDIVEYEKGTRGFAKARKDAAIASLETANKSNLGERTIADIYRLIPAYSGCLEYEKEVESRLLIGNPEMIYLFNKAKENGKRVIITSDMYLPADFIKKVLVSCGIQGWDGFYLSCEQRARKSTGRLWDKVLMSEGVRPSRILHIGDDYLSDFEQPRGHGIVAYKYEKIIERFTRRNSWAGVFLGSRPSLKKRNLMASVAVATHVYSCHNNGIDLKEWIACTFLAVVAYSYSRFIVCDARKRGLEKLLLLARDGYNLEPVINLLAPEIKTKYIYAPRRDYLVIAKNFIDNSYTSKWKFLVDIIRGRRSKPSYEHRRIFIESMKREWAESGSKWDPSDEELFLSGRAASPKLQAAIDGYSRFVKEEYRKYFETLGVSAADKVGLVDMTSVRGSAHRLVSIFSPVRIHSYYYFRDTGRFCDFDFQDTSSYIVGSTTLCLDQATTEYFLSAPTPSIKAVRNCKPIYDDCSYYEQYKDKAVQQIREPLVYICSMFNKWRIIDDIDAVTETDWKEAHLQWTRKNFSSELSFMCSSYGVGNRFTITLYDSLVHMWRSIRLFGHVILSVHTSVKNLQIYYTFKLFGRIPVLKLKLPF